jgi:hypothetical protein
MSELIETLNSLKSDLSEIKTAISKISNPAKKLIADEWLDNQDALMLLHISKRSLQHLRDSGALPHSRIRGKFYYKTTDIKELLEKNYFRLGVKNQSKTLKSR